MCRRVSLAVGVLFVLGVANSGLATTWTNADVNDELWSTVGNWDDGLPTLDEDAWLMDPEVNGPLVQEGIDAECQRLRGPGYGEVPGSDLTVTGGTLTFERYWRIGFAPGVGIVNMSGGKITNKSNYAVYMNEGSALNVSGGVVESGLWIPSELSTSTDAVTTLNMTGGTVNAKDPNVAEGMREIEIGARGQSGVPRPGLVNLHGGTIICERFVIGPEGEMDITEGTLIIDNDVTSTIEGYVNDGSLTAYGGAGVVAYLYDDVNDVTVVTAVAGSPFSYFPQPRHRGEGICPDVVLEWRAGDYAEWQEVYLGTDFNDVNDATTSSDVHVSHQAAADANYDPAGLLEFGTTYYWRVDAVNDVCSPYLWKGRVWNFRVESGKARDPSPADLGWRIPAGTELSWEGGCLAEWHDVYLGTDFNDVNDATDPNAAPGRGRQAAKSYDPCGLDYYTVYYWRVDEVGAGTIIKGDVWQFDTIGSGETVLMCDISAGASTLKEGWSLLTKYEGYPEAEADDYGSDDGALTWTDVNDPCDDYTGIDVTLDVGASGNMGGRTRGGEPLGMDYFFANDQGGSPDADFIISLGDLLPGTYILTTFHNNTWYGYGAGQITDVTVAGGISYWGMLTALPAAQTNSVTDAGICRAIVEFDATGSEEVTLRYQAEVGGAVFLNGFILDYFPPDKRYAYWPTPRDGAKEVPPGVVLSWYKGIYAADPLAHDVYFGTDRDDVNDADTSSPEYKGSQSLDANTYNPGGLLELDTTYYWRIDERNDANGNLWKGNVWRFKTANYIVIDDMESYDTTGNRIYYTWDDGFVNDSGAELYLGEASIGDPVHGGYQSMEYLYDNADPKGWQLDYYSEISVDTSDLPIGSDWTDAGVKILTLFFYGQADNDANATEQLYVGLEDTRGGVSYAQVNYGFYGEDNNDIRQEEWHQWDVALPDFTGVIPSDISKLYIGFGIRGNPYPGGTPGGSGVVYFDDMRLYPPKCVPWRLKPAMDLTDDCIVDLGDVGVIAAEWLRRDVNVAPITAPSDANKVGHWTFEEGTGSTVGDTSGSNYHGTAEGDCGWVAGKVGSYAMDFDGGWVVVEDEGNTPKLRMKHYVSVMAWIYLDGPAGSDNRLVIKGENDEETFGLEVDAEDGLAFIFRDSNDPENVVSINCGYALSPYEWIHVAGTYDHNEQTCYVSGVAENSQTRGPIELLTDPNDGMGIAGRYGDSGDSGRFDGTIDDVRVYDRALSRAEIAWLASDSTGMILLTSEANLFDGEDPEVINFRDLDVLVDNWLNEKLWPPE